MRLLTANKPCTTQLRKLSPFLDTSGIFRVGGRILHASIPYEQKHTALIPKKHQFTSMLIHHYHMENCPGATTLQRLIQQPFWIISARQVIRSHLRLCISCYRVRQSKHIRPTMGNLPVCRLQQIKPFHAIGVDHTLEGKTNTKIAG